MTRILVPIVVLAALGIPGCGSAHFPDDGAAESIDGDGKTDGIVRPVGTYRSNAPAGAEAAIVVLRTDRTFHRETPASCTGEPCAPEVLDGTYNFSKSGATRYLRFRDASGALIDRFAYELADDVLTLRVPDTASTQRLTLTPERAWCQAAPECALQQLPQPRCPGDWVCSADQVCAYAERCVPPARTGVECQLEVPLACLECSRATCATDVLAPDGVCASWVKCLDDCGCEDSGCRFACELPGGCDWVLEDLQSCAAAEECAAACQ